MGIFLANLATFSLNLERKETVNAKWILTDTKSNKVSSIKRGEAKLGEIDSRAFSAPPRERGLELPPLKRQDTLVVKGGGGLLRDRKGGLGDSLFY